MLKFLQTLCNVHVRVCRPVTALSLAFSLVTTQGAQNSSLYQQQWTSLDYPIKAAT